VTNRLTLNLGLRVSCSERIAKSRNRRSTRPKSLRARQTSVNPDGSVTNLTVDNGPPSLTDLPNGIVRCGVTPGVL